MKQAVFVRADFVVLGLSAVFIIATAVAHFAGAPSVLAFVIAAVAVGAIASLVGRSVEQRGERFGSGATGVLQGALANLPELVSGFFAQKAGRVAVVQAAIIGSILSNILLVLGLSFVVGGLTHGTQRFNSERARTTMVLMVLATGALVLPSLASYVHSPAAPHEGALSTIVAVILLVVFVLSLPASLKRSGGQEEHHGPARWPVGVAVGMLIGSSAAAALVSEWFVSALEPTIETLHISQAFAGLVIVAIAGNAVENMVGIQLAARNQSDFAMSVIINSPLQVALVLAPALVLLSFLTATTLTLVFAPMLVMAVGITVLAVSLIVFDGESTWLEGATLIALYCIIATVFWWG